MNDAATLNPPPEDIPATKLLKQNLPAAWGNQAYTTAAAISQSLSTDAGRPLPWYTVRRAIEGAITGRFLEITPDSGPWPCDWSAAHGAHFQMPSAPPVQPPGEKPRFATAELQPSELQDFVEAMPEIMKAGVGLELHYTLRLDLGKNAKPSEEQIKKLNEILNKTNQKLEFIA
jgi:hypothetical protein